MEPVRARRYEKVFMEVFINLESRVLVPEEVDIDAPVAAMPSRIPVAGMAVTGMPGVAAAIHLMRVVTSAAVAVPAPPATVSTSTVAVSTSTVTVPATTIAGALPEIAVAAVVVRRIVMRTVAVPAIVLGVGQRAEGEDECGNTEEEFFHNGRL